MTDDYLIEKLRQLCLRFSNDPLEGRYDVAKKSGVSADYLYQILAGKPMANGNQRSVGKRLRSCLTKAFPDWIDQENSAQDGKGSEESHLDTVVSLGRREYDSHPAIAEVVRIMREMDEAGKWILVGTARQLSQQHTDKKQVASSQ